MQIRCHAYRLLLSVFGGLVVLAAVARAQTTVSINFQNPGGAIAPGSATGVVSAMNWNNVTAVFPDPAPDSGITGAITGLVDGTGATTGVNISYVGWGYQSAAVSGGTTADHQLLNNFSYGNAGHPLSATVTGLSSAFTGSYDVYVYFANPNDFHVISYALGGTTYYTRTLGNFNFGTTGWVEGKTTTLPASYEVAPQGNYVRFAGVSGNAFTLDVAGPAVSGSGSNYNAISGLQIVAATPIPEPATVTLLLGFAAMAGVVGWRRRRRTGA
ncbi:hypothetical protein Verru16b_01776 [Lacunisphaera limnophila]|uniref:Ice-binding protein C-terminal domain-containing protein n=1 Tax=Lacunisphaera limnophila TaxID=1838286 RepID=A0A1D8AUZ0_9BACT|nr:PEP-CTERM sorting domain-containing protein [Lacunisphaera limnophila]AOS44709.1 hypothetical protein Verru16b_01776 [Lacunisphaera limnophila]